MRKKLKFYNLYGIGSRQTLTKKVYVNSLMMIKPIKLSSTNNEQLTETFTREQLVTLVLIASKNNFLYRVQERRVKTF